MFDLLSGYAGKQIIVGLVNGRQLAGTAIEAGRQTLRLETGAGICIISLAAIQVIREKPPGTAESMVVQDYKSFPALEQGCTQMYLMPCAQPYGCFEQYNGQPCPQQFGHCPQRFAAPCFNFFYESVPRGTPCYHTFWYSGHPCPEAFGGFPYPYPPYSYPYSPYPY